MKQPTRKATLQVNQNEGLIFEKSSPGKAAWRLPPLDVPEVDSKELLGAAERKDLGNMLSCQGLSRYRNPVLWRQDSTNWTFIRFGSCSARSSPLAKSASGKRCEISGPRFSSPLQNRCTAYVQAAELAPKSSLS